MRDLTFNEIAEQLPSRELMGAEHGNRRDVTKMKRIRTKYAALYFAAIALDLTRSRAAAGRASARPSGCGRRAPRR
jgi:hypothetical protein